MRNRQKYTILVVGATFAYLLGLQNFFEQALSLLAAYTLIQWVTFVNFAHLF